ncbi:MAG: phospho-sugar mutase [Actinomycetota bacterium]|nr:phospho-sugar mutase [Actinomycetota bacterium]
MTSDLVAAAQAWLAEDPDSDTRAELHRLLDPPDLETLRARFGERLQFGTAGLRGPLGAGPARMNRVLVRRAAAGLASYLRAHGGGGVVVGFDARHKSDVFARDTAEVLTGAGLSVMTLPRPLPTPVLAAAIRHTGAEAGVMVTASHNPPQDNGYKVYLGDGAQIVPPADAEISAAINAVDTVPAGGDWVTLDDEVVDAYVARTAALVAPEGPRDVRVVYTPLHGVGRDVLLAVFARAGFPAPCVVPQQGEPDPDFPTVAFPNPEEPGALDLALAAAHEQQADLVLANDPDADRCAVAVSGRVLRGDEVGALLAAHLLRRSPGLTGTFASSIVSGTLVAEIAAAHGVRHVETLTGFKWIARVPDLRYGYEEALGYCVDPEHVRDKDGISAALLLAELAAGLKARGRTLLDLLDELETTHGVHATDQVSVRVDDLSRITAVMAALRREPPHNLGGRAVVHADDLRVGIAGLSPTDALRYRLEGGARVVVRPSGTEPKLKCYIEVVEPTGPDGLQAARRRAAETLARLRSDLARML